MNNTRLGCLTPAGLVAGGLTLLVVLGIALLQGGGMFSPGRTQFGIGQSSWWLHFTRRIFQRMQALPCPFLGFGGHVFQMCELPFRNPIPTIRSGDFTWSALHWGSHPGMPRLSP